MNNKAHQGWTSEQWKLLDVAVETSIQQRSVEQCRMVMYWHDDHPFQVVEEVWNHKRQR